MESNTESYKYKPYKYIRRPVIFLLQGTISISPKFDKLDIMKKGFYEHLQDKYFPSYWRINFKYLIYIYIYI
jgi:hypothetical protein